MTTSSHVGQFSTRHELGKYGIDWEHDEDRCFDESLGDCVDVFLYKVFFAINVGRYEREKCTEGGAGWLVRARATCCEKSEVGAENGAFISPVPAASPGRQTCKPCCTMLGTEST